jgi:hypothetical protein
MEATPRTWAQVTARPQETERVPPSGEFKVVKSKRTIKTEKAAAADTTRRATVRMMDRRIIINREKGSPLVSQSQEFKAMQAVNDLLTAKKCSARIVGLRHNARGTYTMLTREDTAAEEVLKFEAEIIRAVSGHIPNVMALQTDETWTKVIIHNVPVAIY